MNTTRNEKVSFTSRPDFQNILTVSNEECLACLQFDNTRYHKVSPEHKGSFEWIWKHEKYRKWSTPDSSQLMYIQGKPGSGKSTLTKYVHDNLLEHEPAAKSAIVAKYFYSYRDGDHERKHYNMLRSILYHILEQEETFFYHCFQEQYRVQRLHGRPFKWDYMSLQTVLKSLPGYFSAKPVYLIIDAVDESLEESDDEFEDGDRHDVLKLLFDLCPPTNRCIVKVFVASRPVAELEHYEFRNSITLEYETKSDISTFAESSLKDLNPTSSHTEATEYIVNNAEGVFLWVKLVLKELQKRVGKGFSEAQIYESLKKLPKGLKDFYELMLDKLRAEEDYPQASKMLQFVLFAGRPLTVDEALHMIGISDSSDATTLPSNEYFRTCIPEERYIIHGGGSFLEIKEYNGNTVS